MDGQPLITEYCFSSCAPLFPAHSHLPITQTRPRHPIRFPGSYLSSYFFATKMCSLHNYFNHVVQNRDKQPPLLLAKPPPSSSNDSPQTRLPIPLLGACRVELVERERRLLFQPPFL